MTPSWVFEVMWFCAGVGGTGAVWYFLSQRNYPAALWTGFATVVLVALVVALQLRNSRLRRERHSGAANGHPAAEPPASASPSAEVTPTVTQPPEEAKVIAPIFGQPSVSAPPVASPHEQGPHSPRTSSEPHQRESAELERASAPVVEQKSSKERSRSSVAKSRRAKATIREKSAAEVLGHLEGITRSYEFEERVKELYLGRWTQEPGWQATVYDLPSRLSGGSWHCSFKELGSGTVIFASTTQDISALRPGDPATVSGRIGGIFRLKMVSLEEATISAKHEI